MSSVKKKASKSTALPLNESQQNVAAVGRALVSVVAARDQLAHALTAAGVNADEALEAVDEAYDSLRRRIYPGGNRDLRRRSGA